MMTKTEVVILNDSRISVSIDVSQSNSPVRVMCKQGDTGRVMHISLTDGGYPYVISSDCYAVFTAVKPDGKIICNPCQIVNDIIVYSFTAQTCACPGKMTAEIRLYGDGDKLLTSASFLMCVEKTVYRDGDPVVSDSEITVLTRLIAETNALNQEIRDGLENGAFIGPQGEKGDTGPQGPQGEKGDTGPQGPQGEAGQDGTDGGYYSPAVTQPDANTMRVSFTPSKADMPAVLDADITIPSGGPGSVAVDSTLTVSGQAADAKATGDAIRSLSEDIENLGGGTGTGAPGPAGADGVGIQSVEQTTTSTEDGGTNVITVTKTDGTSSTFAVRNGSRGSVGPAGADGQPGADGKDGLDGTPGQDGITPTIGENGNWYLGDTDTGKPSRGEEGPQGPQGETGPQGPAGPAGADGAQGPAGADGKPGADGAPGADGHTPEYGVDYGTPEQISGIAQKAAEILQPELSHIKDDIAALQGIANDDHINGLINTALGVIENGSY